MPNRIGSQTWRDSLITVWSSQTVFASPAVMAAEIPVTLAGAVEKPQRPPLSVITPRVWVLWSMVTTVGRNGHTLTSSCDGVTLVSWYSWRGWAALATRQTLGCDALSGELAQSETDKMGHHKQIPSPRAKTKWELERIQGQVRRYIYSSLMVN